MLRVHLLYILFFQFFLKAFCGFSQVSVQDSLALVALYNSTDGVNWSNKQNWLMTNVQLWHGVTVNSGRVQTLNLSNNNLIGTLPAQFCDLTALEYMFLSDNSLSGALPSCFDNLVNLNSIDLENNDMEGDIPTGITSFPLLADVWIAGNRFENMPSLLAVTEISNVSMENNLFTFEDIEQNMGILNFSYAPQDSVLTEALLTVDIHDTISLNSLIGGSINQYRWEKNGQDVIDEGAHILGSATSELTLNKVTLPDSGVYTCVITNTNVPLLTLTRKIITLRVNDTRMDQVVNFQPASPVYCGDPPFEIVTSNTSGLPVTYSVSSGPAVITDGDTIRLHNAGQLIVNAFHPGDDFYKPVSRDTIFEIFAHPQSSLFSIQSNSPVTESDSLIISVTDVAGVDYNWNPPVGIYANHPKLIFENSVSTHSGWYAVEVTQNGCFIYRDSVLVEIVNKPFMKHYELITPNGDGRNEYFHIDNIEYYPHNELLVFNAWNQILYREKGYSNDWNGGDLPSGTYYFTLEVKEEEILLKGILYIRR